MLNSIKLAAACSVAFSGCALAQTGSEITPAPAAGAAAVDSSASEPRSQPQLVIADAPVLPGGTLLVPKNTLVRLMVLREVNTRQKKPGDRFVLRVDEAVVVNGVTVVPVGAKAWGEVTMVKENGAAGSSGKIAARLLHIDVGDAQVPLDGEDQSKGAGSGNRVAMGMIGFGILGLLIKGNEGKLKGGHIFNGYIADEMRFDPGSARFLTASAKPAAPVQ
jgi:hypothetical protein